MKKERYLLSTKQKRKLFAPVHNILRLKHGPSFSIIRESVCATCVCVCKTAYCEKEKILLGNRNIIIFAPCCSVHLLHGNTHRKQGKGLVIQTSNYHVGTLYTCAPLLLLSRIHYSTNPSQNVVRHVISIYIMLYWSKAVAWCSV